MGHVSEKKYPVNLEDYKLYEEVGEGVSATVYRALCIPLNETVAIKVLDLEKCNNDLDGVRREVQTMNLIDHPNVLRAYCSFTVGCKLWVVMPYMATGSCLHIMKSAHPEGFEESIIATLLREVLKALVYLHSHGHIHRDVKAGNILIDSNGTVKLADFGVSACMFDAGDRQRSRNTFVGTPCWMAPEVMQQLHGYDFKADIWSFGITALELAHGHAPFSKYPPMKVLLMTLQNAPPGLDYERDKKFSKNFKGMVAACLVKDPRKRPSAQKLLKHSFFSSGCSNEYIAKKVVRGLSPLGDRFRSLKTKEADLLEQNKGIYGDKYHLSQQEYIRGISGWNFNTEDLKAQAALIQDDEGISNIEDVDIVKHKQKYSYDDQGFESEKPSSERSSHSSTAPGQEEEFNDHQNVDTSFFISPLKEIKVDFDAREDDFNANNPKGKDAMQSESKPQQSSPKVEEKEPKKSDDENLERSFSVPNNVSFGDSSGSLLSESSLSPLKKVDAILGKELVLPKPQPVRNYSGTLLNCQPKDPSNLTTVEEISEAVVRCKGRFKVTSADLSTKETSTSFPTSSTISTVTTASIMPSLLSIGQYMESQKDEYSRLMKIVSSHSGSAEISDAGRSDLFQTSPVTAREKTLELQMASLLQSVEKLAEEFQTVKENNVQMQRHLRKLNSMMIKEETSKSKENE